NVGMLTQGSALGVAALRRAAARHLGFSSFVAAGGEADVPGNDLLAYWAEDPRTRLIALCLERVGNPRRFARLLPATGDEKPIVSVKSGRRAAPVRTVSKGPADAAGSPSLANVDVATDALLEDAGVIRTATLDELIDVTALLATQPLPRGAGIAVVSNGGAASVLVAEGCV